MMDGISSRAVGAFPISISTSLALEGAAGIYEDRPVFPAPILKYKELWINVRTLYRNFYGSLDKNTASLVLPGDLSESIMFEMDTIVSVVNEISENKTKVIFYFSNYADIDTKYKLAVTRMDNTDNQKFHTALANKTYGILLKNKNLDIKGFQCKIKPEDKTKALILTNYAVDLLSEKDFGYLTLLESHTGVLLERSQWHRKYIDGKELSQIPYRLCFLQLFGDSQTFRPLNIKWKREIIEIANKYKWSTLTTDDKITYGIQSIRDHYFREIFLEMMHYKWS